MIIGIDFDGTIVKNKWPEIGKPKFMALPVLWWIQSRGHTLILNTCREGKLELNACWWLLGRGVRLDYVNQNASSRIKEYEGDCRKISCDLLVDDTAGFVFWPWVYLRVKFKELRLKWGAGHEVRGTVTRDNQTKTLGENSLSCTDRTSSRLRKFL